MSYLNFAIEVAALPDGNYRISVTSPVGEVTADVAPPFTPTDIADALAVFTRQREGISKLEETQAARQFGQRLFSFLIRSNEDIHAAYFASLDRAGGRGLRIRLSVENAGPLRDLPWEFLRDPNRDFLALSRVTPVVRYTPQLSVRPPVPVTPPLRVLVIIAAPANFPPLDVEGEWNLLLSATADLRARGLLELERLPSATLIALQRRLRDEDYHVIHYIGHSDFDSDGQQGVIALENEHDPSVGQVISGSAFGREIGEESTVRLVVLNSCHSARRPSDDSLAGIASGIVARGIPAVVAMQFAITDRAAKVFAEEFYRVIAEGMPIDSAISEARRAIANRVQNLEWATPVLFMRSEDGVVFRPSASGAQPRKQTDGWRRWLIAAAALLLIVLAAVLLTRPDNPPLPPTLTPSPTPTELPAQLPDLQIGSMRVSPSRPAPGQIFRLSITITNAGTADSGPFNWSWDASLANPVLLNSLDGRVDNIPPGTSKNISFPFSYGWWGEYNTQIVVDIDSEVTESDSRNNRKPFIIPLGDAPFMIDFSLLPTNEIVQPPLDLPLDAFLSWNMAFNLASDDAPQCADVPLQLVDLNGDVALVPAVDAGNECADLPISITFQRPIVGALVEVTLSEAGSAELTSYADLAGTQPIANGSAAAPAGSIVELTAPDGDTARIRRIDLRAAGQITRITRLVLSPPR